MPTLRLAALAVAAAALLSACGGEAAPYDDGSYSSLQAASADRLAELDVAVTSLDLPAAAAAEPVLARLTEDLDVDAALLDGEPDAAVALDLDQVDALTGAIATPAGQASDGALLVLVLEDPQAAADLAGTDPEVFADEAAETGRTAYVSGNVVAYYAATGTGTDRTDDVEAFMLALPGI